MNKQALKNRNSKNATSSQSLLADERKLHVTNLSQTTQLDRKATQLPGYIAKPRTWARDTHKQNQWMDLVAGFWLVDYALLFAKSIIQTSRSPGHKSSECVHYKSNAKRFTSKRSLNPIPFIPDMTSSVRRVSVAFNAPPKTFFNRSEC